MKSKDDFLLELKAKGWSSPAGIHWDRLRKLLLRNSKVDDNERLLNPLILGGNMASHALKHERLNEQLDWAIRHGCIDEALRYLERLPEKCWNISISDDWDEEHLWANNDQ